MLVLSQEALIFKRNSRILKIIPTRSRYSLELVDGQTELKESENMNLLKLYLSDVGLLTGLLYKNAVVLHSGQEVYQENGITYLPIYYVMFLTGDSSDSADIVIPEIELPKL